MNDEEWLDRLDDRIAGGGYIGPSVAERLIRLARKGLAVENVIEAAAFTVEYGECPESQYFMALRDALAAYEAATKEEST